MRVLALVHPDCIPPEKASFQEADWALWKTEYYVIHALKKLGHQVEVLGLANDLDTLKEKIKKNRPQVVFNMMEEFHGRASFEAHVPSFLEMLGVAYTGCNPQALSLCRDKGMSKKVLNYHGIVTPGFCIFARRQKKVELPSHLKFPLIVKSLTEEASLGISQDSIVTNVEKLKKRVMFVQENLETDVLVEEYIEGREFYIGVLGHKKLLVLPPWELDFGKLKDKAFPIATRNVKFSRDYCAKNNVQRGPARDLDPFVLKKMENISRSAYKALKISGYARLDFRVTPRGEVYFLEANPNAELAKGECLANAAKLHGLSYEGLISKLLSLSQSYEPAA